MTKSMIGKVALVTGGSSGIGKATALAFAAEGAKVVIASRSAETGEQAADELRTMPEICQAGGEVIWIQADVSQPEQVEALMQRTVATYGQLDYAFNNGGSGGRGGWVAEMLPEEWSKTINGFLTSVFLCMKFEIAAMIEKGGVIVNNSSVDGLRAFPWDPAYSAAKHGVLGLTKSAAMQYATRGVRINAVCPGWIRTPPVEDIIQSDPDAERRFLQHQPIGRLGEAREVADAVVWLCSDKASLIVGVSMPVDGGYVIL